MKTSVIRHRVADFLRRHAPFDALSEDDLLALAGSGRVRFHESEEYVLRQGEAKGAMTWVVQQGRVEMLEESSGGEQLSDVRGEGDVLGLELLAGKTGSPYSARTATDVILYGVASAELEALIAKYPAVERFVSAQTSMSGIRGFGRSSWLDAEAPSREFLAARQGKEPGEEGTTATTRWAVGEMVRTGNEEVEAGGGLTLSSWELALFCGYDAPRMVREIRESGSTVEVATLAKRAVRMVVDAVGQPTDVDDCRRLGAAVTKAIAESCIRQAEQRVKAAGLQAPSGRHCWVMWGASGRGDRVRPGAPNVAVIHEEGDEEWYAAMAMSVAGKLISSGTAISDPSWPHGFQRSMSVEAWRALYADTIRNPLGYDLYGRRELFDLAPLAGDADVMRAAQDGIPREFRENDTTLAILANDTLGQLPPMTFFHGLVLELDGAQRETFDIGKSAITPISDSARVFALSRGRVETADTLARLDAAAGDFPEGARVLGEAAEAFRAALYYQAVTGSPEIRPGQLRKIDQVLLKSAFSAIQRLLEFTADTFIGKA
jgi:signal-transduction protein with cAMP-binding, CBS, and nucleotidyltransferase domain